MDFMVPFVGLSGFRTETEVEVSLNLYYYYTLDGVLAQGGGSFAQFVHPLHHCMFRKQNDFLLVTAGDVGDDMLTRYRR